MEEFIGCDSQTNATLRSVTGLENNYHGYADMDSFLLTANSRVVGSGGVRA